MAMVREFEDTAEKLGHISLVKEAANQSRCRGDGAPVAAVVPKSNLHKA